jgi:hypothetical protein
MDDPRSGQGDSAPDIGRPMGVGAGGSPPGELAKLALKSA